MNKDWFTLIEKSNLPGARDKFENICGSLFKKVYPDENVRIVEVNQGDGGIDIFIGKIGISPIHVIQCKFFPSRLGESQKRQIRESFKTAIESEEYTIYKWSLCIPSSLDLKENKWLKDRITKMNKEYDIEEDFIELIDGDDIIDLLKEYNLYNSAFEKDDSLKIDKIYKSVLPDVSLEKLKKSIFKTSLFLHNVKNYFEKEPNTHIERKETSNIINWVKTDLQPKKKNLLVLEGDKGLGKSVILKE